MKAELLRRLSWGFRGIEPLMRAYIGQGLRKDLALLPGHECPG